MKVADLAGPLLDYWVARARGLESLRTSERETQVLDRRLGFGGGTWVEYCPSGDWAIGGPIIEREQFGEFESLNDGWGAGIYEGPGRGEGKCIAYQSGPNILVAAMRAYVASKFGEEVGEVPREHWAPPVLVR